MYLAFITLAMCVVYFILLQLFPIFFAQKITLQRRKPFLSLICIVIFSVLAYVASFSIQDIELSNRVLHIFGGAFLGFFVCFLATRDSRININKFQFFVFGALIVLALAIANELLEFVLQEYGILVSAINVNETWLDLASNVVGIILASIFLVPFHKEITSSALDHI